MKYIIFIGLLLAVHTAISQRKLNGQPDIVGYITLKADFHIHTDFSDGVVWPTFRVDEAMREGIDVIALTDHIEYRPHQEYIKGSYNASYDVAAPYARERNVLLIKGVEITRPMPTGHFNALFVQDVDKLADPDFLKVMEEANRQGAFVFWNHPGWKTQQPDGTPKFHAPQLELLKRGWLHGIEFHNTKYSYGFVLDWCNERNLTALSNSDVHIAASDFWEFSKGGHRPVNLLFAKDKSESAVKDALKNGRTLAWTVGDTLAGKKEWADAFFKASIEIKSSHYDDKDNRFVEIINRSSIPYYLDNKNADQEPHVVILAPNAATSVRLKKGQTGPYRFMVRNILIGTGKNLDVELAL